MGYEGLAETIVSALLTKSTVQYPFVVYEYSQIKYKDRVYSGYKSADYLADGYYLIPLEKLYRKFTGGSLAVDTAHQGEIKNQIKFLVTHANRLRPMSGGACCLSKRCGDCGLGCAV